MPARRYEKLRSPCTAVYAVGDAEDPVLVTYNGSIAFNETATCQIHARLSNGTELVASIAFETLHCCGNTALGEAPTFRTVDGGTQ